MSTRDVAQDGLHLLNGTGIRDDSLILRSRANIRNPGSNGVMPNTAFGLWFALAIGLATASAVAQESDLPPDALIRLQRTSCLGPCPIYTVTIDARGTVTYEGERFVRVVGRRTAQIDKALVATLLSRAERIRFFQMRDAYRVIEKSRWNRGYGHGSADQIRQCHRQRSHKERRRLPRGARCSWGL